MADSASQPLTCELKPCGQMAALPWHALTVDEVFAQLQSSPSGLDTVEVEARLLHYGSIRLPDPPQRSLLQHLLLLHLLFAYLPLANVIFGTSAIPLAVWIDSNVTMICYANYLCGWR